MRLGAAKTANANHSIVRTAAKLGVTNCVANRVRLTVPQPTEWERIQNQIDAEAIFARADFVNVATANHGVSNRSQSAFRVSS
jgi:hypothetical protein